MGWELFNVAHHPARFVSHKHYGIGDVSNEFVSLAMIVMEREKIHCFSYRQKSCKNDKILHQKHEFFTFELRVIKLGRLDKCKAAKNVITSKRYIFSKRVQKNCILWLSSTIVFLK